MYTGWLGCCQPWPPWSLKWLQQRLFLQDRTDTHPAMTVTDMADVIPATTFCGIFCSCLGTHCASIRSAHCSSTGGACSRNVRATAAAAFVPFSVTRTALAHQLSPHDTAGPGAVYEYWTCMVQDRSGLPCIAGAWPSQASAFRG